MTRFMTEVNTAFLLDCNSGWNCNQFMNVQKRDSMTVLQQQRKLTDCSK